MNFIKNHKSQIFILIFILFTFYVIIDTNKAAQKEEKLETKTEDKIIKKEKTNETKQETKILVDIKGEVISPGVYELTTKNAVIDAINKAGGLTKKSDTSNINLSKKVQDEMVIIVYSKEEIKKMNTKETTCPQINNACVKESDEKSKLSVNTTNTKVNINTADLEALQTLNSIGEIRAKAIIEYRQKTPFNTIEDIKNVSGIGDSAFEKIKDNITV
jgi:competence protein ComEA